MKISACLERAIEDLKRDPAPFIIGTVAVVVPNAFLAWLARYSSVAGGANWLITTLLSAGMVVMATKVARKQPADVADLGAGLARPVPYLVISLAITAGAIACGVGVFVTGFLFMYATLFAARGDDFGPALRKSKDLALANVAESVMLFATVLLLILGGVLACGVGIFVTLPLAMLTMVHALDELEGRSRAPVYGGPLA